jgi:hypothetical protein
MDIWYQLADHNGNPFMGTSIDKVSLKPDAYVVDLRDAVKIKLADSHLRGISPSDLKVFTSNNKTETLLSPRARLRDYMSDTLIVKVPAGKLSA